MGTQFILVQQITHHIFEKVIGSTLFKWVFKGVTIAGLNIILLQGIIEQAAVSSRRLREQYPSTYHKLTPRNLDMIYFLAEEYLEPFVAYTSKSKMFCEGVNHELSKVLKVKLGKGLSHLVGSDFWAGYFLSLRLAHCSGSTNGGNEF